MHSESIQRFPGDRSVPRNLARACRVVADEGCDFAVVTVPRPHPPRLAVMLSYAYPRTRRCKEEAVKDRLVHDRGSEPSVARREFLAQAGAAALGFTIAPRHVLGGKGYVPPSDKVNIAFIGVGSQGQRVMLNFLREPDVQGVAVCDPNRSGAGYPQWDTHEFCHSVRGLLNVTSGWDWLSPDDPIQLTHSLQVTSGVSGREPCQKIVDAYNGAKRRSGNSRGCLAYSDFRELLDRERDIDAVVVCTTDNLHEIGRASC